MSTTPDSEVIGGLKSALTQVRHGEGFRDECLPSCAACNIEKAIEALARRPTPSPLAAGPDALDLDDLEATAEIHGLFPRKAMALIREVRTLRGEVAHLVSLAGVDPEALKREAEQRTLPSPAAPLEALRKAEEVLSDMEEGFREAGVVDISDETYHHIVEALNACRALSPSSTAPLPGVGSVTEAPNPGLQPNTCVPSGSARPMNLIAEVHRTAGGHGLYVRRIGGPSRDGYVMWEDYIREAEAEELAYRIMAFEREPSEGKEKGPGDSWQKVRSVLWLYIDEDEATVDEATQKVLDALEAPGEKGTEEGGPVATLPEASPQSVPEGIISALDDLRSLRDHAADLAADPHYTQEDGPFLLNEHIVAVLDGVLANLQPFGGAA